LQGFEVQSELFANSEGEKGCRAWEMLSI